MEEARTPGIRRDRDAATIKDVARAAGVSVATVSRVLNGSAPVREPTRRRILDAAREMHFMPNASARSLSTRRTTALGVVLPDIHGEFFSELLRGIDRTAQKHGRHLLVSSSHHGLPGMSAALRAMYGRVDGLIVMAPDVPAAGLIDALPHMLPTVLVNCALVRTPSDVRLASLAVDNFGGALAMVRHLVSLGHRRIAFISGAAHNEDAAERERGYRDAMREAGLDVPAEYQPRGEFTEEGGLAAADALIALSPRPTAIFAANDMMALGALALLRERGLTAPGDIAVTGFDDVPTARHITPPLTTVRVDVEALGARAVALLLEQMSDARQGSHDIVPPSRELFPASLVVRESCGAQKGAALSPDGVAKPRDSTAPESRSKSQSYGRPSTAPAQHGPVKTIQETIS
jgi:LacI family transcriptional regulator